MKSPTLNDVYKKAPREQREQLAQFRATHPQKQLVIEGGTWWYLAGGQGEKAMVFLPGGLGLGEAWFQIITAFEQEYRTIAPTYPPVATMR